VTSLSTDTTFTLSVTMAYTQSRMLLARVNSLELKASDVSITLCNLLASSQKHGHSLTQAEETELYMCMDFLDTWMPRVTSSILDRAFEEDLYDDAIEEWADKLDTELRNLVKDILSISSPTASSPTASPSTASPPTASAATESSTAASPGPPSPAAASSASAFAPSGLLTSAPARSGLLTSAHAPSGLLTLTLAPRPPDAGDLTLRPPDAGGLAPRPPDVILQVLIRPLCPGPVFTSGQALDLKLVAPEVPALQPRLLAPVDLLFPVPDLMPGDLHPDDGGEPPPTPDVLNDPYAAPSDNHAAARVLYALHTAREVTHTLPMMPATTVPVRSSHIVPDVTPRPGGQGLSRMMQGQEERNLFSCSRVFPALLNRGNRGIRLPRLAATQPWRHLFSSLEAVVSAYLLCRRTHIKLMFEPREDQTLRTLSSLASSRTV